MPSWTLKTFFEDLRYPWHMRWTRIVLVFRPKLWFSPYEKYRNLFERYATNLWILWLFSQLLRVWKGESLSQLPLFYKICVTNLYASTYLMQKVKNTHICILKSLYTNLSTADLEDQIVRFLNMKPRSIWRLDLVMPS